MDFNRQINITVSQNAPCNIKENGAYPSQMGWNEVNPGTNLNSIKETEVWIKTATLGGRRRMWVK